MPYAFQKERHFGLNYNICSSTYIHCTFRSGPTQPYRPCCIRSRCRHHGAPVVRHPNDWQWNKRIKGASVHTEGQWQSSVPLLLRLVEQQSVCAWVCTVSNRADQPCESSCLPIPAAYVNYKDLVLRTTHILTFFKNLFIYNNLIPSSILLAPACKQFITDQKNNIFVK